MKDVEMLLRRDFLKYLKEKSKYADLIETIYPRTPQSFSKFPTIVMKEVSNIDDGISKTLNNMEYVDNISYQIELYTKDIVKDGIKISSLELINDLKYLIHDYFRIMNFERETSQPSEYIDMFIDKYIFLFTGRIQSWNAEIV